MRGFVLGGVVVACLLQSCSPAPESYAESAPAESDPAMAETSGAAITAVETSGDVDNYTFSVTVQSDETGCDRYADWWEVITPEGELLYRRILAHSHVDEQPFTRSGGPVEIEASDEVLVRSHVNPDGYSTQAMRGSVSEGFSPTTLPEDFALALAEAEPQPGDCAF